jgi:hypothetical protein
MAAKQLQLGDAATHQVTHINSNVIKTNKTRLDHIWLSANQIFPLFILVAFMFGCSRNALPKYDANPNSLQKYLGVVLPESAKVTNLAAQPDDIRVLLQAKVEITKEDLAKLATALKMTKEADFPVPKGYLFPDTLPGTWWDPPEAIEQWKSQDRYAGRLTYPGTTHTGNIAMIWVNGIAYIYKFGP